MTVQEVMEEIRPLGRDSYKSVLLKHGIQEPVFGVSIDELKKIQKRVKMDHGLSLGLYTTGVYDAMYLAGLIADDKAMTPEDLQGWVERASCSTLSQNTVAWVAAGGLHGREMAMRWIYSGEENIAAAGWATYSSLVATKADSDLDSEDIRRLLSRVRENIHRQPNRVRQMMNGFIIAVGSHVAALTDEALDVARAIGVVTVDMGETACKVPDAVAYIKKVQARGAIGKKRKSAKC